MKKNKNNLWLIIAVIAIIGAAFTSCEEAIGPQGEQGVPGNPGMPGSQVEIKEGIDQDGYPNMTWWINGVDTNIAVAGKDGSVGTLDSVLTIGPNGNWFIDGEDTLRPAHGPAGTNGTHITISHDITWVIDGVDTHIPLTGPAGNDGTIGSVIGISDETGNWTINGNDTGVSANSGGSGGNGNGGSGGGEPPTPPCAHATTDWRLKLPMPNIVSLLEEQYCTICDEGVNRRRSYGSLTNWLKAQSGGTTVNNPIALKIAIALGDTRYDTDGWGDLLTAIQAAGKYVSFDLSDSTITNTGSQFQGSSFSTGKAFVVSITFPYGTIPQEDNINNYTPTSNGFTNLKSVKGYGNVGSGAFRNCASLIEVDFRYATTIGDYAFRKCTGLTEVSFPNVTTINYAAFEGCINLEQVSFPLVTTIRTDAFRNCSSLERVYFPKVTILSIAQRYNLDGNFTIITGNFYHAFEGCTSLTEAYLPLATSIPNNTFLGCNNLTEVYARSATSVDTSAFSGNTKLERLYIPLVRSIGANALTGCDALTNITIARNATIDATGLSARAAAFRTYYEGTGGRAMGTYTWNGTAWTGAF